MKVKRIFKDVMKQQVRTNVILCNEWEVRVSAAPSGVGCAGLPRTHAVEDLRGGVVLFPNRLLIYVLWYVSNRLFSHLGRYVGHYLWLGMEDILIRCRFYEN